MAKFKIRGYAIGCFSEEVEAESLEKAQEIFLEKQDAGEYEFNETVLLEGDEGFEVIDELVSGFEEESE